MDWPSQRAAADDRALAAERDLTYMRARTRVHAHTRAWMAVPLHAMPIGRHVHSLRRQSELLVRQRQSSCSTAHSLAYMRTTMRDACWLCSKASLQISELEGELERACYESHVHEMAVEERDTHVHTHTRTHAMYMHALAHMCCV